MRFSERKGIIPVRSEIQVESMDQELCNSIWNVFLEHFLQNHEYFRGRDHVRIHPLMKHLYVNFFKEDLLAMPDEDHEIVSFFQDKFVEELDWYEVYDLLEEILNFLEDKNLEKEVNNVLVRELAAYRFVNYQCIDVTSDQEIEMLEEAVNNDQFPEVSSHLSKALALYSDRKKPDYANSIKESISAVEALARVITNKEKATLGDALAEIDKHIQIHPALKKGFSAIYGYTSDEGGIRHALSGETKVGPEDAKYFLLSCTSFTNYLKEKMV